MANAAVICKQCGTEIAANHVVNEAYCSIKCSVLASFTLLARESLQQVKPELPAMGTVTPNSRKKDADSIEEEWEQTGRQFDAVTERALLRQKRSTGTRSIILAGSGADLRVDHDCLIVTNGTTYPPQEIKNEELCRAVHDVQHIIWVAATGSMSFSALEWIHGQGINLLILDTDGNVIAESTPQNPGDIALKRRQYAMSGARRIDIAEWLVLQKVEGQYKTYKKIPMLQTKRATEAFTTGISLLTANPEPEWLRDLNMIRLHEGRIAKAYFAAWKEIPLKWSVKDKDKVATHWKMVGDRQSPLGNGDSHAQHAVTPAQAILNFAYAELEHVTRAALLVQGFDTSVGILHADRKGRDSLVFDLMELGRGAVDALVLGFINKTDFHEADFIKIVTGEVRLHPALARAVVASCSLPLDIMIEYACQLKELVLAE